MHYAFDLWLEREFPAVTFERYADDAVVHCATERQAKDVLAALEQRMAEVGLRLHPDKTRIVFCKDGKRRYADCANTSFTFLGYTFRARKAPARDGTSTFTGFLPAVSKDALKKMSGEVRSWRIHLHTGTELEELAARINPVIRGWMTYYGKFYRTGLNTPAAAHQHLPDALGAAEVQAAAAIQESQGMVAQADREAATHVRPLGLDARILTRLWMRRAE
jgi:RNA-directed DNA polymerase